jgi:hypothetical protein
VAGAPAECRTGVESHPRWQALTPCELSRGRHPTEPELSVLDLDAARRVRVSSVISAFWPRKRAIPLARSGHGSQFPCSSFRLMCQFALQAAGRPRHVVPPNSSAGSRVGEKPRLLYGRATSCREFGTDFGTVVLVWSIAQARRRKACSNRGIGSNVRAAGADLEFDRIGRWLHGSELRPRVQRTSQEPVNPLCRTTRAPNRLWAWSKPARRSSLVRCPSLSSPG